MRVKYDASTGTPNNGPVALRLAEELLLLAEGKGPIMAKKRQLESTALSNRGNASLRW